MNDKMNDNENTKTVAAYTLGCKVNTYDTESILQMFIDNFYTVVDFNTKADVYIINTCAVTNLGSKKSRQIIRKAIEQNDDGFVVACGCYAQVAPDEILSIDGVDLLVGTKDRDKIIELVEEKSNIASSPKNIVTDIMKERSFENLKSPQVQNHTRAYIKIQDGCEQYCSYCIIPYARGRVRSRDASDIYSEVKSLSQNGYKEVILTGIHIASYGKDFSENISLIDIIENINSIDGIERIRISSIEPTYLTEEIIIRLSKLSKLCPHFHMSLQSGCDQTLKDMNRKYTVSDYMKCVNLIREHFENSAFTTDVIVGFPEETDSHFDETVKFCNEVKFSKIHVFPYSPKIGTPAEKRKQVPENIKNSRSKILLELSNEQSLRFMNDYLGKSSHVLLENTSKNGIFTGYTENYIKVQVSSCENVSNTIQLVNFTGINKDGLVGKII